MYTRSYAVSVGLIILFLVTSILLSAQLQETNYKELNNLNTATVKPSSSVRDHVSETSFTGENDTHSFITKIFEDVKSATGYRYFAHDDKNCGLDGIKIIEKPSGGYLGIYHSNIGGIFYVRLAESDDLLNWRYVRTIEEYASQPTIAKAPNGAYLVAFEKEDSHSSHLKLHYYPNLSVLINGLPSFKIDLPRSLSSANEGTPNIYNMTIEESVLNITMGFHYNNLTANADEVAIGWLKVSLTDGNWTWQTKPMKDYTSKLRQEYNVKGNIGDRDFGRIFGMEFTLQEGNLKERIPDTDWSAWRIFLYNHSTGNFIMLNITTHKGSTSFGNPTFTLLKSPAGRTAVVVTYYVFSEGAADGEMGPLIFYKELDYDIVISNITLSRKRPIVGEAIQVYVTVENLGCLAATFNVTANYTRIFDPTLGVVAVTLNSLDSITLNFTWIPESFGRYQILACANGISGDADPNNNQKEIIIYVYAQTKTNGTGFGFRRCFLK